MFFYQVITLFLAVAMPRVNLNEIGLGLIVGWLLWMFFLPLSIELVQYVFANDVEGT